MADLSKIKLNGVEYNIKDATARALAQSSDWEAESEEAGYIDNKPSVKAGTGTDAVISGLIEDLTVDNTTYSANVASGNYSYAEGYETIASGNQSHAEGVGGSYVFNDTTYISGAKGQADHAEGYQTIADNTLGGNYCVGAHAEGYHTQAIAHAAHAEGASTEASGNSSHAEGGGTKASGSQSHAEGFNTTASGANSHAEGAGNTASSDQAHAEGASTTASGMTSHAEGSGTTASGYASHAEGAGTKASGAQSHAEGAGTKALSDNAHAEGGGTTASGASSHAEGGGTTASAIAAHAEGGSTTASGNCSHAEGSATTAFGSCSHTEGNGTTAAGESSHAEGIGGTYKESGITYNYGAFGKGDHSEGYHTIAKSGLTTNDYGAHAEGFQTNALAIAAHTEGQNTAATFAAAHAEGSGTTASALYAHAEGGSTTAAGESSHAEGSNTRASGSYSHAEGAGTTASANSAHAEGGGTKALRGNAHAEGYQTEADGDNAHAEGATTKALTINAHAEGTGTTASGSQSHAEGYGTAASGGSAHAEGSYTTASSTSSHAEGNRSKATNENAHAEGDSTTAAGNSSHAEGHATFTTTGGMYSHAEGDSTKASGQSSHAEGEGGTYTEGSQSLNYGAMSRADHSEGYHTVANSGQNGGGAGSGGAHAEGNGTKALNSGSHAEGSSTTASGASSHAEGTGGQYTSNNVTYISGAKGKSDHTEGYQNIADSGSGSSSYGAHAEGYHTQAIATSTHAEGNNTVASGDSSHAEGGTTQATADRAHAEGGSTVASGVNAHAEGGSTIASGVNSHAEGSGSNSQGKADHSEGYQTFADSGSGNTDYGAHAEGAGTKAQASAAHAEGAGTKAQASAAHAEGSGTTASGNCSHAEGAGTTASGDYSHAEGSGTKASAGNSHAEGNGTTASNANAHAEGGGTQASGVNAHAEGNGTKATSTNSHAEGTNTIAQRLSQHVFGEYNIADTTGTTSTRGDYVEIVGNGTADNARSNARTLDWDGNEVLAGKLTVGAAPTNNMDVATKQYVDTAIAGTGSSSSPDWEAASGESGYIDNKPSVKAGTGTGAVVSGLSEAVEIAGNTYPANTASGDYSHAEGFMTTASGIYSHAEGVNTTASQNSAHAEGQATAASGNYSHAEGRTTAASGTYAHAEGNGATASGESSHAEGANTTAQRKSQHVFGEYNVADEVGTTSTRGDYVEIVGNGTSSSVKSNARTLDWSGNEYLAGSLTVAGGSITLGNTTLTEEDLPMADELTVHNPGRTNVYCWGDSLTEGVGAYVMQPDGHNAYMAYSYPAWLGQNFNVINLGARSEDICSIMARQGADPIVIQTAFTIPASKDTPVKIGEVSRIYTYGAGTGFTSKSGNLVKLNKEVESPGLNPCLINGVEGIIYRELTSSSLDDNTTYNYYFKRLESGDATAVPVGTEVETQAMRYYRNGYAVIWMGANGGYTSHNDFVSKVNKMVTYGKYKDYLVILAREFAEQWAREIMELLTDEDGYCHVIYLMDELPDRGYQMAGIGRNSVDTSTWQTTDPIKKNAPLLCDHISGQSGENEYGGLHFSAWGYKAIAKLVEERLMARIRANTDNSGGSGEGGGGSAAPSNTDEYGHYVYKLSSPRVLDGSGYLNTKIKLYEDVTSNWTLVCKYSGVVTCNDGYPANILCCMPDGGMRGALVRYTTASDAMVGMGSGGFALGPAYNNNTVVNFDGTNVMIMVKNGHNYKFYCNNTQCAYGAALGYTLTDDQAHDLPLLFGARWNTTGTSVNHKTAFTLEDARVYDTALDDSDVMSLYMELTQPAVSNEIPLATAQNDGLMSALDKQVLDGLNPNVEATLSNINQTTYQIINAKQENLLGMTIAAEPVVSQQIRTSNLLDVSSYTPGFYISANGSLSSNANDHVGDFIPVSPGDTIYYTGIIGPTNSSSINRRLHVYTANQTWIKQLNFAGGLKVGDSWSTSGVIPSNGAYVRVSWGVEDYNIMITVGAPTRYEPYYITPFSPITSVNFKIGSTSDPEEATTYTYNVPSAAGDQYGFSFDPVSGKLYQLTGHIASYNGETLPGHWQSDRDIYVEGTTPQTGAEVIYRLADEDIIEYDGTPMTIPLNLRTNYFFTYGGFLQELKYYAETFAVQHLTIYNGITYGETNVTESNLIAWNNAADAIDTKADLASPIFTGDPQGPNLSAGNNTTRLATAAFVQERLSNVAPFQTTNKARKNYEVGQYLYMNGWMYKVTAAIAQNATITVGTNVERTDVATELELLFSLINNA